MKYIKSIFAVSIVAMAVVGNARASIVSQTNIVGGSNVSVTVPTSGNNVGKVVISATDTNTTYTTGNTTYSGTTKLYTGTGDATDGTLTQKAIKSALAGKENTANKLASGGNMAQIVNSADADTKYPTVKAALAIAQIAAGAVNDKLGQLASKDTVYADLIDTGAVTSDKIADGTIAEADLSDAVKTKLNATVQTFNPATATPGKYVTNFTKNGTTVTATTAYVQIPVGSATAPTSVASIWVE